MTLYMAAQMQTYGTHCTTRSQHECWFDEEQTNRTYRKAKVKLDDPAELVRGHSDFTEQKEEQPKQINC